MNRNISAILAFTLTLSVASCNSEVNEETTVETTDSTAVVETEESPELAYDGVDKGEYTLYGHIDINADGNETSLDEMNTQVESIGNFEGKLAVTINEVCQKAGCWITFNNGDYEPVRVFFKDHFTIPTETPSGTEVIIAGRAVQDTVTVEFQKHLLKDAAENGKPLNQKEYDAINEDKIELTFECDAILVKK